MRPLGSTNKNGYRLFGSVRCNQSSSITVSPPGMVGRISRFGWGDALDPVSPPTTRILPLGNRRLVGYQRPRCECFKTCTGTSLQSTHLKGKGIRVFLPIVGFAWIRIQRRSVEADPKSGSKRPTANVDHPRSLVWQDYTPLKKECSGEKKKQKEKEVADLPNKIHQSEYAFLLNIVPVTV
jgi:hypothetical protein